jgi:hypothetical protein
VLNLLARGFEVACRWAKDNDRDVDIFIGECRMLPSYGLCTTCNLRFVYQLRFLGNLHGSLEMLNAGILALWNYMVGGQAALGDCESGLDFLIAVDRSHAKSYEDSITRQLKAPE